MCKLCISTELGSDKPKISELHDHVRGVIAPQWYDLGIQLLDDEHTEKLDVIQSNHRDSEQCCTAMFQCWLKVDKAASWDKLITALKHVSHVTLAEKIKAMTSKGGVGMSTYIVLILYMHACMYICYYTSTVYVCTHIATYNIGCLSKAQNGVTGYFPSTVRIWPKCNY